MGSIQQSILGVICIASAFLLGQYMRNHPSPEALAQQQRTVTVPSPSFGFDSSSAAAPRLPAPSAGFAANQAAATEPTLNPATQPPAASPAERQIDVPDFSQLAASFQNTPLALPGNTGRNPESTLNNGNASSPNVRAEFPAAPPLRPAENAGQPAYAGSRPEAVAPPQPMEAYEMKEWNSSFRREDFQPRLMTKETSRRTVRPRLEPTPAAKPNRLSLAPPEPDNFDLELQIPDIEVVIPKRAVTQSEPSLVAKPAVQDNQVHSYYDGISASTTESYSAEFRRADFQPVKPNGPPRIPFGLNEQGKEELARIRSRQQSKIDLPTTRFSQHTTRPGDTLQSLSTEFYGKPDFYLDIYLANQQTLRSPTQLPSGIQLRIPDYE